MVVVATAPFLCSVARWSARIPWVGDAQASLLYVSNWHFLAQSNDYFAADIDSHPFLHFWSLSIEEQFYFVFPLLLVAALRAEPALAAGTGVGHRRAVRGLGRRAAYWAPRDLNRAYYGTDARLYQLLAGVLAAMPWRTAAGPDRQPMRRCRRCSCSSCCWSCSAACVAVARGTAGCSPRLRPLGLVLALIDGRDRPARLSLSRPPMVYLGQISYGTYLWHWPVILVVGSVFAIGPWETLLLAGSVATGLAALSFEILESPIRRSKRLAPIAYPTLAVGIGFSALVAFTVVPSLLEQTRQPAIAAAKRSVQPGASQNIDGKVPDFDYAKLIDEKGLPTTYCESPESTSCVVHQGSSGLTVLLAGDSQSLILGPAFIELARKHDFTLLLSVVGRCPWQHAQTYPGHTEQERVDCTTAREVLYGGQLKIQNVDVVVLIQVPRVYAGMSAEGQHSEAKAEEHIADTVSESLRTIEDMGANAVMIHSPIKTKGSTGPPLDCLAAARKLSRVSGPGSCRPVAHRCDLSVG